MASSYSTRMVNRSRPSSVPRAASVPLEQHTLPVEEYTLDERELAALEKLYAFPGRTGLSSGKVRALNIVETLSELARAGQVETSQPAPPTELQSQQARQWKKMTSPAGSLQSSVQFQSVPRESLTPQSYGRNSVSQELMADVVGAVIGHAVKKVDENKFERSGQAEQVTVNGTAFEHCDQRASATAQEDKANGARASSVTTDKAVQAVQNQRSPPNHEALIAQLLAQAALNPPPPIPSRRPDPTLAQLRGRGRGQTRVSRGTEHAAAGQEPGEAPRWRSRSADTAWSLADQTRVIFDLAREGDAAKLRTSLSNLEPATYLSLTDRHGHNVAHVLAACGHVHVLSSLANTCGPALEQALRSENKRGVTPCLAAVRCGQLDTVRWLVERYPAAVQLTPEDGGRSLLHAAARHGQVEIAAWCADRLLHERLPLDTADHRGETPLHLAARAGNTLVSRVLLDRGASITVRNGRGLRPYDLAAQQGQHACAEYLLTYETLCDLAADFCSLEAEAARLQTENTSYKDNFREVLSVARKLARERDDLSRDLLQLQNDTRQLHSRLLQQLPLESCPEDLVEAVEALHLRWQHCLRAWCGTSLEETQARLRAAEQAWQRLRASRKDGASPLTGVQEIVRNKIGDIRAQAAPARLLANTQLSSSDDSLFVSELKHGSPPTPPPRPTGAAPPASVSTPYHPVGVESRLNESTDSGTSPRVSSSPRRQVSRTPRSTTEKRGHSADDIDQRSSHVPGELLKSSKISRSLDFDVVSSTSNFDAPSCGTTIASNPDREGSCNESVQLAREELRMKLRELALVSESGSATVLDVIEPSGSEAGSTVDLVRLEIEAQQRARAHSAPPRGSETEDQVSRQTDTRSGRSTPGHHENSDFLGGREGKHRRSRKTRSPRRAGGGVERRVRAVVQAAGSSPKDTTGASAASLLSPPDILQGTQASPDDTGDLEREDKPDRPLFELEGRVSSGSRPDQAPYGGMKRRFLQKFGIRARWSGTRRKERPPRNSQEITSENFRETYLTKGQQAAPDSMEVPSDPLTAFHRRSNAFSEASSREVPNSNHNFPLWKHNDARTTPLSHHFPVALEGGGTGSMFTAVRVMTHQDSLSEHSRSPSVGAASILIRPLLAGGVPKDAAFFPDGSHHQLVPGSSANHSEGSQLQNQPVPRGLAVSPTRGATTRHTSPAPSEVSRTESALAPPSETASITESARHLDRVQASAASLADVLKTEQPRRLIPQDIASKSESAPHRLLVAETSRAVGKGPQTRRIDNPSGAENRPWYEVSDDDSDQAANRS